MKIENSCGIIFANDFWECSCEKNFIHRKSEVRVCPICKDKANSCDSPDARLNEMLIYNPEMLTEKEREEAVRHLIMTDGNQFQIYPPLTKEENKRIIW